jgi:integrase
VLSDDPEAPVFPATNGRPLNPDNLRNRVLKPAAEEADVSWIGFHSLRHTFASLHIYRGTNVVQLQKLLGHHSASFTLDRYTHLMPGEAGTALDLEVEIEVRVPQAQLAVV